MTSLNSKNNEEEKEKKLTRYNSLFPVDKGYKKKV